MKTICLKLDNNHIPALLELSEADGFPCALTEEAAKTYCAGKDPADTGAQTYGVFADGKLVSVMTGTFCAVFPHRDSPNGRVVHISGAFTLPAYRHRRYATELLTMIEADAAAFGADYLCCDSTANGLYRSFGFEPAPENETRMWKSISIHKEDQQ